MEKHVKEFLLVGLASAFFSIGASFLIKQYIYWLFMGHTQFWAIPPWELVTVIWISIMYFLYVRQICKWLVIKEMGI